MGVHVAGLGSGGAGLSWVAIPFNAADFTASAGIWTVAAVDVAAFRYALLGNTAFVQLAVDAGAQSAIAVDLFVALPAIIAPVRGARGFMLTNAGGSSEAGLYYMNAGIAILNLRRIAGNWPVSANFQVATEFFVEIA